MADANASAFATLDGQIKKFLAFGKLPDDMGPKAEAIVSSEIARTITAGTDAYGTPWSPKKAGEDGGWKFVKPGDVATTRAGLTITAKIVSRTAYLHHAGIAKGHVRRQIIPTKKLPRRMADRLREAATATFREIDRRG